MDGEQRKPAGSVSEPRSTKALRLPPSLKTAAKLMADREGVSLNEFIARAIAEKVERLEEPENEGLPGKQNLSNFRQ